jgi:outer membrane protein
MAFGFAPFGRFSWGEQRYVSLQGNYVTVNLLEDPNWRFGPAGMWRFGRKNVDDPVVRLLPEFDGSLELGAFAAYETVGDDPRDRWRFGTGFTQGVTGSNDGYVATASMARWIPVGRYAALNLSLGTTFGSSDYMDTYFSVDAAGEASSGLATFAAGSGVRDVRLTAIFIQPLSREWLVGGGVLYSRLMNDAAASPIVSERGDRDQLIFGVGFSRAF